MIGAANTRQRKRNFPERGITKEAGPKELASHPGIEDVTVSDRVISITYDLDVIQLKQIFDTLAFDINKLPLVQRLFWRLAKYIESIAVQDLNYSHNWDSIVRHIYVANYLPYRQSEIRSRTEGKKLWSADGTQKGDDYG